MEWLILFAGILDLILAYIIVAREPRRRLNRLFGFFSAAAAILTFFDFIFRLYPTLTILRTSYALAALMCASGALWVPQICRINLSRAKQILLVTPGLFFFFIAYIDGLLVQKIHQLTFLGFRGELGPLFPFYALYFAIYLIFFGSLLYLTQKKATSLLYKLQLRYALFGLVSYGALGTLFSLILPTFFNNYSFTLLDAPSSILFVGFTTYAITRYRFLDIRLIILRTLSFVILVALITGVFAALSAGIGSYLEQIIGFRSDVVIGLIVALIVTSTYQPSRKFIGATTNKFLYKKGYNPDRLLSEVSQVTSSILDLDNLLAAISKLLVESFHCEKIGVGLLNKKNKLEVAYEEGFKTGVTTLLINYPKVIEIMYQQFKETPGIQVIDEMRTKYENGEFKPVDPKLLEVLYSHNVALIIPLYVKERKLIGLVAIGTKKSGDLYTQQDLSILEIIAGQSGVAIENAQLYDELKEFNKTLQQRVDAATKELRAANTQLREMDRMKSDFISIASHQLRTPLTVIKGYISMMREGSFGRVPAKILDQLAKVYAANERLIGLVENLLDISRIESGRQEFKWEPVQVEQLAATVVDNLGHNAAGKGLKLMFQKPKQPLPVVIADASKLHEVMMNFVDNAIKYTKEGEIVVSVSPEPAGMVTFEVKDTGIGMTPEGMSQLFKKFSRAQGSFQMHTEGLGLGLFVAKMLLDIHHGIIGAESGGKGTGSRFFFSVPLKQPKEANGKPNEPVVRYLGKD